MSKRIRLLACSLLALAVTPAALGAQEHARHAGPLRSTFGGTIGVMSYGTGDDVNCGTGVGVVAGRAVRSARTTR